MNNKIELYTIIVDDKSSHPYWKYGKFVAPYEGEYMGKSVEIVEVPHMYLSYREAQSVIDEVSGLGVKLKVVSFVMK